MDISSIPNRPTTMAEFWPADGRTERKNKDGVWLVYKNVTIGPFPNRSEASWYDGQVQDIIHAWNEKEYFVGRIVYASDMGHEECWFVERWDKYDGPFMTVKTAHEYRQSLYDQYNLNGERLRAQQNMKPGVLKVGNGQSLADSGSAFGRMSESGRVHVTDEGKVAISGRNATDETSDDPEKVKEGACVGFDFNPAHILAEPKMVIPESLRPPVVFTGNIAAAAKRGYEEGLAESGSKPKKTTDDIVPDGSFDLNEFLQEQARIKAKEVEMSEGILKGLAVHDIFPASFTRPPDDVWVIRNEAGEEVGRVKAGESVTFEKGGIYSVGPEEGQAESKTWWQKVSADITEKTLAESGGESVKATDGLADHIVKPKVEKLEREPMTSEFWQKAKDAVTKADGKCLYSFGVHIDPSTGEPHRNDHICNHMCHLLAKKARLERNLATAESLEDTARRELVNAERSRVNQKRKLDIVMEQIRDQK